MHLIDRQTLDDFLRRLNHAFARPGRLYLIGETSQLLEGWRDWVETIDLTADIAAADRPAFEEAAAITCGLSKIEIREEFPGDVIPLPDGYEERARPISLPGLSHENEHSLRFYHFDPFSVAFRFIARGDEEDYRLVLNYMKNGWLSVAEMNDRLEELLTRFAYETIQQDPAEFRRKYKGLLQMWQAANA